MKKKWFRKDFEFDKYVTDFLNKLSENGVDSNEIKICSIGTWVLPVVWYYSEKKID